MKIFMKLLTLVFFLTACSTKSISFTKGTSTESISTEDNRATQNENAKSTKPAQANLIEISFTLTPSRTKIPTFTPRSTITPIATPTITISATPTPTFDRASAITFTPATPAKCPADQKNIEIPEFYDKSPDEFEAEILTLLNTGAVQTLLTNYDCRYSKTCIDHQIASNDLTGDHVPELIIRGGFPFDNIFVFGCQEGQYVTFLIERPEYEWGPEFIEIKDANLNGMNDLVIKQTTCHWCFGVRVWEWRNDRFVSLVREEINPGAGDYWDIAGLSGYSSIEIIDTNENGTYEIVINGGVPSWSGGLWGFEGPYRSQTAIYSWNGQNFTLESLEYEHPRFRFEAVQDGDGASERGEYDKALALYQDAIFSDKLGSWTSEEWFGILNDPDWDCCNPPDPDKLSFNGVEYSQLSAYSRYRIMLLHLLRGWEKEAQIVYETLKELFPPNDPGYPYVQLANEFWAEYQLSNNIPSACQKAIVFAKRNKEILVPLGNDHGIFSRRYTPETICPFR